MPTQKRPQIDYEQELKIVRKFLQKNNFDNLVLALSSWGFQSHRVKVNGFLGPVPNDKNVHTEVPLMVESDPDAFFDPGQPERLTVPPGLGGQYYVHAEVRWMKFDTGIDFDLADRDAGMFYSHLRLNGNLGLTGSSRATCSAVPFATGTTQHCTAEVDLNPGDYVQLVVNQCVHHEIHLNAWLTMRRVGPIVP